MSTVNTNQVTNMQTEELGFKSMQAFANLQRVANMFNKSSMVPQTFQGEQNLGNAVIAIEMAVRMSVSPLMVMQNLYVVYGNPSWSSKFLIATFNQCGRFSSIKYKFTGKSTKDCMKVGIPLTIVGYILLLVFSQTYWKVLGIF